MGKRFLALVMVMAVMLTVMPVFADEIMSEAEQIRARWADISANAIEVPVEQILAPGETLITDGSVDYVPRIQALMNELTQLYEADKKWRVIKFPAGTFNLPIENPTLLAVSGVGIRGAGSTPNPTDPDGPRIYATRFTPAKNLMESTVMGIGGGLPVYYDIIIDGVEIDGSSQVLGSVPTGTHFYHYKALYVQRISNFWVNDVYAHETLGTSFGLDYIYDGDDGGLFFLDCYAKGSGRGTSGNTNGVSGPGAAFGITTGQFANEQVKFVGCTAEGAANGGFYLEVRSANVHNSYGYSILDSKAFNNTFGVDDQGVENLIIEDSEFYNNKAYGIRRGAVDTGEVFGKSSNGAGSKGRPGSMYVKRSKIYSNGSSGGSVIRSAGVHFSEKFQVDGINKGSKQVFEDVEIYNNRGYGISNAFALPRYVKLKGATKIYANGGSGIHFRQGYSSVNPTAAAAEVITITTEGDDVEIYNNGACGDSSLWDAADRGASTGIYGDGVTLSANSVDNNMKFKAYGNKGRAIALRPYFSRVDFTISDGIYSGDWTGQGIPYRNEIGAASVNNKFKGTVADFGDTESYINYTPNGNGNAAGDSARAPSTTGSNPSAATGFAITRESTPEDGDHFKIYAPEPRSDRRLWINFDTATPSGFAVPKGTQLVNSVLLKPNNDVQITANGNASYGSAISEYRNSDPICTITIPKDVWTRVDFANSSLHSGSAPVFGMRFVDLGTSGETVILAKNIMCLDKPDIIEYFDGASDGGAWSGTPYRSSSSKSFDIYRYEDVDPCEVCGEIDCICPDPCEVCGEADCICPEPCDICGEEPCVCPEPCEICGEIECTCPVGCEVCGEEICICPEPCDICGEVDCVCPDPCDICGKVPCECPEPCDICGKVPCECPDPCDVCGKVPCECEPCDICGKVPCECEPCDVCGKVPCECPEPCDVCGKVDCVCEPCDVCGEVPCECEPCDVCGKVPCECIPCDICGEVGCVYEHEPIDMEIIVTGISFKVVNNKENRMGHVIMAVYDTEGKLIDMQISDTVTFGSGGDNTGSFSGFNMMSGVTNKYSVKLFLWSGGEMIPLSDIPAELKL